MLRTQMDNSYLITSSIIQKESETNILSKSALTFRIRQTFDYAQREVIILVNEKKIGNVATNSELSKHIVDLKFLSSYKKFSSPHI